jgi:glutamyl-tRNA reductase
VALVFIGSNFRDSELSWLERLEAASSAIRARLDDESSLIDSHVSLATCNRFELYFETDDFHRSLDTVIEAIAAETNENRDSVSRALQILSGDKVAPHLFSVTSGLDSMIVGESEVTGQVRRALSRAQLSGPLDPSVQQLFQTALRVSKKVSHTTGIGSSGKSVITTALKLSEPMMPQGGPKQVLIIGTGAYARVVTAFFKRTEAIDIAVYSGSGRAEMFAETHSVRAVTNQDLVAELSRADIVISASGSMGHLLEEALVSEALGLRTGEHDLVIVDVALSKDVAPGVHELAGCFVLDLERLKELTPEEHSISIDSAREIVKVAAEEFELEQRAKSMGPIITALRDHIGMRVDQEIDSVKHRLDPQTVTEIRKSLSRVKDSILHTPSLNARNFAGTGNQAEYVNAIRVLFDIEIGENG